MTGGHGRPAIVVAVVAVAAVAVGGVLAYRQSPTVDDAAAAPLVSVSPQVPQYRGPVEVKVKPSRLTAGRAPSVPYFAAQEVRGGAGTAVQVPGTAPVVEFARLGQEVYALQSLGSDTSVLLRITSDRRVERVPKVLSVRSAADQSAVAYTTHPRPRDGVLPAGGTLYVRSTAGHLDNVDVPRLHSPRILAFTAGKVWLQGGSSPELSRWKLYSWVPGDPEVTEVRTPGSPTALSPDAKLVALRVASGEHRACSTVNELATGRSLWRTCDYGIEGFTPDGTVAIGGPAFAEGWAAAEAVALNAATGKLLRRWSGAQFIQTVVEDDQHVLIVSSDAEESPRGVLRCSITTGGCELAAPLVRQLVHLGR